jgi:hypothetical protein
MFYKITVPFLPPYRVIGMLEKIGRKGIIKIIAIV